MHSVAAFAGRQDPAGRWCLAQASHPFRGVLYCGLVIFVCASWLLPACPVTRAMTAVGRGARHQDARQI